ncbi:unnamed protein product [Scytosiphon promiscuus]
MFMWHLWRNARLYGLTPQPVSTSHRPIISGTIMARDPEGGVHPAGAAAAAAAIYGDDGRPVVSARGETVGVDRGAGTEELHDKKSDKFPVCTFVLTTLDDHEKVPRNGAVVRASAGDGGADGDKAGVDRSVDVVLFVVEGARPLSCRSWEGEDRAATGFGERDWFSDGPFPEDVAQQASQLVERLLRLVIAQRRRDTVWELFNLDNPWSLYKNAMVLPSKREGQASSPAPSTALPPLPQSWNPAPLASVTGGGGGAAGSRYSEFPLLRAPSPALSFTSVDTGPSVAGYHTQGLEGSVLPPVSELNLRDLLEVSVVTPLTVALPALRDIVDHRHGVDWGGWFQRLVDSPSMRTLVFEDGDAVLPPTADDSDGKFDAASAAAAREDEAAFACDGDGASPRARPPTRRVLLALPTGEGRVEGDDGEGSSGVGPWVGSAYAGPADQAASVLFCVILYKESNVVEVDVVQRQKTARLTERERTVVSAFVDDMLEWCADDVLSTSQEELGSLGETAEGLPPRGTF